MPRTATLVKNRSSFKYFPVNYWKFFKVLFLQNSLWAALPLKGFGGIKSTKFPLKYKKKNTRKFARRTPDSRLALAITIHDLAIYVWPVIFWIVCGASEIV